MRYIVVTLLLANLGYFAYDWYYPAAAPAPKPVVSNREPKIELLDERRPEFSGELLVAIENPLERSDIGICEGIGPFLSLASSQNVQERLGAVGFPTTMKIADSETGSFDYRVMLPPHATAEEAFRRLRELQARDIDSYVITQGAEALGISMGVFSTEAAAERVQDSLRREGYSTEIMAIPQLNREFWLFAAPGLTVDNRVIQVLGEEHAPVTSRLQRCNSRV